MRSIILCILFLHNLLPASFANSSHSSFVYTQAGKEVKVWYFEPQNCTAQTPVVIVMHGVGRNGEDYLKDWIPYAEKKKFILIVPEFSKNQFPSDAGYNYGNTVDKKGNPLPENQWSFYMIEPIFDAALKITRNQSSSYSLFGHSAGAQFVQRFIYFVPHARLNRVIAANAGWYMLPNLSQAFPYGLKNTKVSESDLKHSLGLDVTVLLGTEDTDPNHAALRHTPEADAQGLVRLDRGKYFYASAKASAAKLSTSLNWKLAFAPGIAHSDSGMASFAAELLFP